MLERQSYPPGVPCWIDTIQPDVDAALAFYGGLFGWEFEDQMPEGSEGAYLIARLRGSDVAAIGGPLGPDAQPTWRTYVAVTDVDKTTAGVKDAGGSVVEQPADALDAGRMATFADPEGAAFCVWEPRGHIGAQLVNEPGTWNFSDLNCRDSKEAARFYGDVFGWEVQEFDFGGSRFTIFKVAGYGEFLMDSDAELRANIESIGGPGGFSDAVAMLVPQDDGDETPPHWSITFAVDDADEAASRAEALGGTVLVPPFDAEPVRMTILADPQGTVFTASRYQPGETT